MKNINEDLYSNLIPMRDSNYEEVHACTFKKYRLNNII